MGRLSKPFDWKILALSIGVMIWLNISGAPAETVQMGPNCQLTAKRTGENKIAYFWEVNGSPGCKGNVRYFHSSTDKLTGKADKRENRYSSTYDSLNKDISGPPAEPFFRDQEAVQPKGDQNSREQSSAGRKSMTISITGDFPDTHCSNGWKRYGLSTLLTLKSNTATFEVAGQKSTPPARVVINGEPSKQILPFAWHCDGRVYKQVRPVISVATFSNEVFIYRMSENFYYDFGPQWVRRSYEQEITVDLHNGGCQFYYKGKFNDTSSSKTAGWQGRPLPFHTCEVSGRCKLE